MHLYSCLFVGSVAVTVFRITAVVLKYMDSYLHVQRMKLFITIGAEILK